MTLSEFRTQLRSPRLWALLAVILTLTVVHQNSGVQRSRFHDLLDVVPYLCIMLGAFWFGFAGAMSTAILTSTCYLVHLIYHEHGDPLDEHFPRVLNIAMYLVVGVFTGFLAQRQIETAQRHKHMAERLNTLYQALRQKTEELFRAEEATQRANRLSALGELSAGLAHEVGNPLGGIKGAAEILLDKVEPGRPEHRFAQLIVKEVGQLDEVVSRFLESVRADTNGDAHADIREVIGGVVDLCRRRVDRGSIALEVDVPPALPAVHADPGQLHQAFLNLVLNAIQATAPGGTITVRARLSDDGVSCEVADTGHGIEAADVPRVFDPFFTRRTDGTGLGLPITHRIIEGCGGSIRVRSDLGRGTTFTVTLPVDEHD